MDVYVSLTVVLGLLLGQLVPQHLWPPAARAAPAAPAAAQMTTSRTEDRDVLLAAEAAADSSQCPIGRWLYNGVLNDVCPLASWTALAEPCGDGHDDEGSGWLGVRCDARDRVAKVDLAFSGVAGELLPFFGRLGALVRLDLAGNPALRGDVADLAGATGLRYLELVGCPLVVGEAAALAALVHLGEESSRYIGGLYLRGSGVHGPVAALRALPGLGADWGSHSDDFSPCSAFGGQQASGDNDYTWGTGSPGCDAAGLPPVAVRRNVFLHTFQTHP
eukprot:COSAG04_NODE_287_length_17998_cov_7.320018_24_plen_276_part_00